MIKLEITFLSVGCADGIHIRFYGNDKLWHNIFIDGGRKCTYQRKVRPLLDGIVKRREQIDLWIITHIDDDHIGALLYAVEFDMQKLLDCNFNNSKVFYNYNEEDDYVLHPKSSDLKSVAQGIKLIDCLKKNDVTVINNITSTLGRIPLFNSFLTILSPNCEYYRDFINKWSSKKISRKLKEDITYKSSTDNDYNIPYSELILRNYIEDRSVWNKSSIAFLFEFEGYKYIFSADSSPNTLYDKLVQLGYSPDNKISIEFLQLPHHGSKKNITKKLLSIIDCNNFIVSANAINKYNLPNKEALSRVISVNNRNSTKMYFTAKNVELKNMFINDKDSDIANVEFNFTNSNLIISLEDDKIKYSTDKN